jgi:hypothetical protein
MPAGSVVFNCMVALLRAESTRAKKAFSHTASQRPNRVVSRHPACPTDVRFYPKSDHLLQRREMTFCAMYGRRPRCKGKVGRLSEAFGCSHVFGLWMQPLWLLALM